MGGRRVGVRGVKGQPEGGSCHCLSPRLGVKELKGSRMRQNRGTLEAKCEVNKNTLFNPTPKAVAPLHGVPSWLSDFSLRLII